MWRWLRLVLGIGYCALFLAGPSLPAASFLHDYFAYLPPMALISPLILFLAWHLLKLRGRRFSRWDGLSVAALAILILWGFEIRWHPAGQNGQLRVMTLNIQLHKGDSMPGLTRTIRDRHVDVLFMQEVQGEADSVPRSLQRAMPGWSCEIAGGCAILSRWPLSGVRKTPLGNIGSRRVLSATVQAPRPFRVLTVHWSAPDWGKGFYSLAGVATMQKRELRRTLEELHRSNLPVIFGGDLNNPPRHQYTQELSREYTNAFSAAGVGPGWTLPSYAPIIRIDHLFSSGELEPVHAEVGPSEGSDHRSLIADYVWKDRRR